MRKFLVVLLLFLCPVLLAQQPQFGGIISNHPFTQGQAIGLELTWLGLRSGVGTTNVLVKYQYICDNGSGSPSPSSLQRGSFLASDAGTNNATFGFAGLGAPFPCNGWLVSTSMLVTSPNTITPGELYAQLQIQDALALGTTIPIPATTINSTTSVSQAIQTGLIEEVLCNGEIVSGTAVSWPSCAAFMTHPAMAYGTFQNINVANPASITNFACGATAAAPCPIIANQNQVQVINATYTLATSASAGNRFACLAFTTGGISGTIVGGPYCSPYAQQPSQTVIYNFSTGVGWATNCSFIGSTQTALQCASIEIPLPLYWEANGTLDNFAIVSCVTAGNVAIGAANAAGCSNGFQTGDQISNINIRVRIKHAND